jgi:hypothetical protein
MGFPDDLHWGNANKAERVKMIGNSVSCGLSRALATAWLRQCPEVVNYTFTDETQTTDQRGLAEAHTHAV